MACGAAEDGVFFQNPPSGSKEWALWLGEAEGGGWECLG